MVSGKVFFHSTERIKIGIHSVTHSPCCMEVFPLSIEANVLAQSCALGPPWICRCYVRAIRP